MSQVNENKFLFEFRSSKEKYLKDLARDNAQLLINQIWEVCKLYFFDSKKRKYVV